MEVYVSENLLTNVDDSYIKYASSCTKEFQKKYPYDNNLEEINSSYTDEYIEVLFYNHSASILSAELIVVTNYRIFSFDSMDNFKSMNLNSAHHNFMNQLKTVGRKKYWIEVQSTNNAWYIFKSRESSDQYFVTQNNILYNRIMELNKRLVEANNKAIKLNSSSDSIKPNSSSDSIKNNCSVFVGPMTDKYEYDCMVFTQAENINWMSNNGDFNRAMEKIIQNFNSVVGKDQCIFNFRYTTQNMGDTYSVNAVGDRCNLKKIKDSNS